MTSIDSLEQWLTEADALQINGQIVSDWRNFEHIHRSYIHDLAEDDVALELYMSGKFEHPIEPDYSFTLKELQEAVVHGDGLITINGLEDLQVFTLTPLELL